MDLSCSTGYQLYGLDIARSDNVDLTPGTPIVSPVNGWIAHHWAASTTGDCVIIAVAGYPISAVDSFPLRRISLCHVLISSQAYDGAAVQQGVTPIGTITAWPTDPPNPPNHHLHFSIYDLAQGEPDVYQYRTPVPFTGDMQIAGCNPYTPNGTLNWAARTYTGTAQFTGTPISDNCSTGSAKPGGWWLGPTPSDGSAVLNNGIALPVSVHGQDYTGSGLKRIDITWETEGSNQWSVQSQSFALSPVTYGSDYSYSIPAPVGGWPASILISFNVYTNDGQSNLAPQGMRRICSAGSPCAPVTVNPPGGGGSSCTTPPSTDSDASGSIPGNNGWWRSPVTLTLTATSPCGQAGTQTYYSVNGGALTTYTAPIPFNQQGIYNVTYYSVDGLGNREANRAALVEIDWTPPVTSGSATGPRDTNGIFRDNVTVGLAATDNLSGVANENYSLNGGAWITLPGANNSFAISGNGVSRAQYYSVDIAGNTEQPPKDSGPIIINKYVVFSNGTNSSLRFLYGTGVNIAGDIFSNGSTTIDGNTDSSLGTTFTTAGTANSITSTNTDTQVPAITAGAPPVPMLAYPLSLYQSLATVVFPSDLKMDSVSSTLNSIIYVQGNVEMDDVALSGPLSIVATGSITDNTTDSAYQTNDPHNGVLMYAGQNININSTGSRNLGLMYAPNGTIEIGGATNLTLSGSLVANQVEVNAATGFNLTYSPAFSSSTYPLPLTAMGLVAPATHSTTFPGVPTLLRPASNGTVSGNRLTFLWSNSSNAIGYQLQVSKASDFSSYVYNTSQLSTAQMMNLPGTTTYYWRVRAINQAGMSAWSTVGTFRTQ